MKKVLFAVFAVAVTMSWPTSLSAADNCGCTAADVTCINNCTLSKVATLKQNIQAKKAEMASAVGTIIRFFSEKELNVKKSKTTSRTISKYINIGTFPNSNNTKILHYLRVFFNVYREFKKKTLCKGNKADFSINIAYNRYEESKFIDENDDNLV